MQATGIFKSSGKSGGHLRQIENNLFSSGQDVKVPPKLVNQYSILDGADITGECEKGILNTISDICGMPPEEYAKRKPFMNLTAISPHEKFILEQSGETAMRIVDLIAPLGRGSRCLIAAQPKAGKTTLMEQIAKALRTCEPELRIIMLLIDERPEEVTDFRRQLPGAIVLASSSDHSPAEHIELAELVLALARAELECGRDVVILADSLTRMGRAFNLGGSTSRGRGRTMSGGLEASALAIPRKFFGAARKIEEGGSVTIIATALLDTGSKMDQLIFEEFKGTGNCEIMLDRSLAEARIFPAIDLCASGTRKEAALHGEDDTLKLGKLRRVLSERKPDEAMLSLLKLLDKYPENRVFLDSISL